MKLNIIQKILIFIPIFLLILLLITFTFKDLNLFAKLLYHPFLSLICFILLIIGVLRFLKI